MGATDKAIKEAAEVVKPAPSLLDLQWPYDRDVNLHQRLMLIMRECTYIQKSDKKAGMQFDFVSYDVVAAKIHPLLTRYGVLVHPSLIGHTINGNRVEAVYDVTFTNVDNPEDKLVSSQLSFGVDNQDKAPGKACTYAVKTALLRTFCLEAGKGEDPDANQGPENDHRPATITDEQVEELADLIHQSKADLKAFLKHYKINALQDMPPEYFEPARKALHSKLKQAQVVEA